MECNVIFNFSPGNFENCHDNFGRAFEGLEIRQMLLVELMKKLGFFCGLGDLYSRMQCVG